MFKWFGKVPEWLNGAFSKNVVSLKNTEGSNPSFSANPKNNQTEILSKIKLILHILSENRQWWVSLFITFLAGSFFLTISTPQIFSQIDFFNQRWFGLSILAISLSFLWFTSKWKRWSSWHSFTIWFQSSTLLIFSFIYFLRLNQSQVNFAGLNLNTNVVFIPITLLIFVVCFFLYNSPKIPRIILLAVIGLYLLQTFSILHFINIDRTSLRGFTQDWLSKVSEVNPVFIIIAASIVIGSTSIINLVLSNAKSNIQATIVFSLSIFSSILVVETTPFTYWYKTLLILIVWDFLYRPFKQIFHGMSDSKFSEKLTVSVFYHGFLTALVIIIGFLQ